MDDAPTFDLGEPARREAGAYRVLARKYRPQTFDSLIGQEAMVRTLSNAFASGRIAHAFMLTGVRGVGKTTTARIIARALNCIGPDGTGARPTIAPCGECEPCRSIAESSNLDVQEMDAASRTGIDDIREIVEGVRYAPASLRYKVYIIDEVHMLSKAAFNGLLKTLEEPPPHVKFIFATTEIRKVPVTVLSRCQRFDLRRIVVEELVAHLEKICTAEAVQVEKGALALVARAAEGSVRDALSLLDQAIAQGDAGEGGVTEEQVRAMLGLADRTRILDLYEAVMRGDAPAALKELRHQYDAGAEPLVVIQDLLELTNLIVRMKLLSGEAGADASLGEAHVKRGASMAAQLPMSALTRAWQILLKGVGEVRDAPHPIQAAEMLLVRLVFAAGLPSPDKLVRQIMQERQAGMAPTRPRPAPVRSPEAMAPQAARGEAVQPAEAIAPASLPQNLSEIVALASASKEPVLRFNLERYVRIVRFEPGRIELSLVPGAPRGLTAELSDKLARWTGMRWIIAVVAQEGAPTIREAAEAREQAEHESVRSNPLVAAIFEVFPKARILDIRRPSDLAAQDMAEPSEESDE